jgi:myosin heavy subunit
MALKKTEFSVQHYAGKVTYDSTGFLDKNKDELHQHISQLLTESHDPFISSELFKSEEEDSGNSNGGKNNPRTGGKKRSATVCQTFRTQLEVCYWSFFISDFLLVLFISNVSLVHSGIDG